MGMSIAQAQLALEELAMAAEAEEMVESLKSAQAIINVSYAIYRITNAEALGSIAPQTVTA
jgi:hypothetical protein